MKSACEGSRDIIDRFESGAISPEAFHHSDHVRLAFAYLCEFATLEALEKFRTALKRFAALHGKAELYNETITCAYLFLIRERMYRDGSTDWENFARCNRDLLMWKDGILSRYYKESTLKSEVARSVFVFPDRCLQPERTG